MSAQSLTRGVSRAFKASSCTRGLSTSRARWAVTSFKMPAMSPTMTEGGIASWKVKEGDTFVAGDILLEIETDKATMDVEAQDDGIVGKIITADGAKNVPVGQIIAMLAEEGDDISNIEVPVESSSESSPLPLKETSSSSQSSSPPPPPKEEPKSQSHSHSKPTHPRTLFPSVSRLLSENGITDASKIKATGVRGMLTKGDVLAHLGKASNAKGTSKNAKSASPFALGGDAPAKGAAPKKAEKVYDATTVRALFLSGLVKSTKRTPVATPTALNFDEIVADYLPKAPAPKITIPPPSERPSANTSYFDGLI